MLQQDRENFRLALRLAERGLGCTWPNPSVGCVITRNDQVVGRGWTQPGGRPHAETVALRQAGDNARGGTAYVTLEPCSHVGHTPPCTQSLIAQGIARVVTGPTDPDPRVSGQGIKILEEANIDVCFVNGYERRWADQVAQGFVSRIQKGRPLVTLKLASSLDGKLATYSGHSQWVTGEVARRDAHMLRARTDGILIGTGTALTDNPSLTVRIEGMTERIPVRIVLDRHFKIPLSHTLIHTAHFHPTYLITQHGYNPEKAEEYLNRGVKLLSVPVAGKGLELSSVLSALGQCGLTHIMVEGGGQIAASFLESRCVDRIVWYCSSKLVGADGISALGRMGFEKMTDVLTLKKMARRMVGCDEVTSFDVEYE